MSECLHCEINDLVDERIQKGDADVSDLASMIAESLVDLILTVPEADQAKVMALAVGHIGQLYLEKSGGDGGAASTH